MERDFFQRYSGRVLILGLLITPLLVWGSYNAYQHSDNRIGVWLPQEVDSTVNYRQFQDVFESGEYVVVSWPGCTLEDVRLESFVQQIEDLQVDAPETLRPLVDAFDRVTTGQRLYDTLRGEPADLSHEDAIERLRGNVLGPDGTTCAILSLAISDSIKRPAIVAALRELAEMCDVRKDAVHVSGDGAVSAAIDAEGKEAVRQWIAPSAIIALVVAWLCLRSLKQAFIVFALSQLCATTGEAMVFFSNDPMNLLVNLCPVLIYVLTLSSCVHLINYYRDAVDQVGLERGPMEALRMGWAPCLLSAITTSLGLVSLCVSQVMPVRSFGYYSAVGVALGFCTVALFLPAVLSFFRVGGGRRWATHSVDDQPGLLTRTAHRLVDYRVPLLSFFGVSFIILAAGLPALRPSVEPLRFLPTNSLVVRDTIWHREHVAPLTQMEIIVGVDDESELDMKQRLALIRDIQRRVVTLDRVAGAMSAATFAPELSDEAQGGLRSTVRRLLERRLLEKSRQTFLKEGFLGEQENSELWRITVRVKRFKDVDYEQLQRDLHRQIQPALDNSGANLDNLHIAFTGGVPLIFAAQRELLHSLTVSFSVALGMIALVMVLVLRSPAAGLASMAPNVFPALVVFGLMGWRGSVVDVGAMMTASIALGIAVDDTLHFLTWFRRATSNGATNRDAVCLAFQRCAPAMTHTTLIAGLGLVVFGFSTFQPVAQFGLLMFTLLVAALFGDLLLLPALLATRIGDLFADRERVAVPAGQTSIHANAVSS